MPAPANTYFNGQGQAITDFSPLLSTQNLELHVSIMNDFYGKYGWEFSLAGVQEVSNDDLYYNFSMENMDQLFNGQNPCSGGSLMPNSCLLKTTTHAGGPETLNVWITNMASSNGLLGYATFPFLGAGLLDGVVMDVSTLPNGAIPYHQGKTLVHEGGHWLGLFHTFQGGCSKASPTMNKAVKHGWLLSSNTKGGDYIDDTPSEKQPFVSSCANLGPDDVPDSCPGRIRGFEGKDPIHNIMDYGWDECITEVTDGQFTQAHVMWRAFREPVKPF
jgi:hypothetical protein